MHALRLGAIVTAMVATAAAAGAQSNGWYNPYVKGLKAFDAARYDEAVRLLERAVDVDPRSARNKYIEGVYRTDYQPYYYLAIAYSKVGAIDKAQATLAKALRAAVPPQLAPQVRDLQQTLGTRAVAATAPTAAAPARPSTPAASVARTHPGAQARPVDRAPESDLIVTNGQAVVRRTPDVAYVTLAVETRARSPREAQQQNADVMNAVVKRLTDAGIARDALRTVGVRLEPEFDTSPQGRRTPRGFVARNAVEATIADVARTGELAEAGVQAGATAIEGIRFDLKDRVGAEREAMRLAVADARALADAAAAGAGRTIDRVVKIEGGRDGDIIMPRMAMARMTADASAPTPVEPGNIEIRARVTLTASMR
jgi:uncharacterized protein